MDSIHSICRICLVYLQNENSFDLFCIPGLAKKLCVCTSLSVEPQDGFPKNICYECCSRLNDLAVFQRLCVDSVQKFQEMVAANAFIAVPMSSDIVDANVPQEDGDAQNAHLSGNQKMELFEEDIYKMSEYCDMDAADDEQEFIQEELENNEENQLTEAIDPFNGHRIAAGDTAAIEQDPRENSEEPIYLRLRNKYKLDSWSTTTMIDTPKRKQNPDGLRIINRIIECDICHKKLRGAGAFKVHKVLHSAQRRFRCTEDTCFLRFETSHGLREHSWWSHGKTLHTSRSEKDFNRHLINENCLPLSNKCKIGDNWSTTTMIDTSKRKQNPDSLRTINRIIECDICHKKLRGAGAFKVHKVLHSDQRRYRCTVETCLFRFKSSNGLRLHSMIHEKTLHTSRS